MAGGEPPEIDYRFSLANERTFLAWLRTAVALVAAGLLAAKAIDFSSDAWRLLVGVPPIVGGAAVAVRSRARWRAYDRAMREGRPLPSSPDATGVALALAAYAVLVLAAAVLDT